MTASCRFQIPLHLPICGGRGSQGGNGRGHGGYYAGAGYVPWRAGGCTATMTSLRVCLARTLICWIVVELGEAVCRAVKPEDILNASFALVSQMACNKRLQQRFAFQQQVGEILCIKRKCHVTVGNHRQYAL